MEENKDTTFRSCMHGSPQCERCKNKRVIEWVSINDGYPKSTQEVLVINDEKKLNIAIFILERMSKEPVFILRPLVDMNDKDFLTVRSIHGVTHWAEIKDIILL